MRARAMPALRGVAPARRGLGLGLLLVLGVATASRRGAARAEGPDGAEESGTWAVTAIDGHEGEPLTVRMTGPGGRRAFVVRLPDARGRGSAPTVQNGMVYVSGSVDGHELHAVDAMTGALRWSADLADNGASSVAAYEREVVVNTESCTVIALDARTGDERWRRRVGEHLFAHPTIARGAVYASWWGERDGPGPVGGAAPEDPWAAVSGATEGSAPEAPSRWHLGALDLATGVTRWETPLTQEIIGAPVVEGDAAYFSTMDGVVWRVDARTGAARWRVDVAASSAIAVDGDGRVLVSHRVPGDPTAEQLVALDARTGRRGRAYEPVTTGPGLFPVPARVRLLDPAAMSELVWGREGARPTVAYGRVLHALGAELRAIDPGSGRVEWSHAPLGRAVGQPIAAGGKVIFGTDLGEVCGVDAATGALAWAFDVGEPIAASPVASGGWVYVTTTDGALVGIDTGDARVDGWPTWGGDAARVGAEARAARLERSDASVVAPATLERLPVPNVVLRRTATHLRAAVEAARPAIRACLASTPVSVRASAVELSATVAVSGEVRHARVSVAGGGDPEDRAAVSACVEAATQAMRLPAVDDSEREVEFHASASLGRGRIERAREP